MTPSIRTFLLINLLLCVTLITSLAIIGNLFLAHRDIQVQLDAQLVRTSLRMDAFFSFDLSKKNIAKIQTSLDTTTNPKLFLKDQKTHTPTAVGDAVKSLEFQVWDSKGLMILHSANAPRIPLSKGKSGLSTIWLNGESWRVSTLHNPNNKLTIMVTERSNYRQQLENQLTKDSIFIMLITYPFLGFLIWIIVGRGLDSLKKVAKEVSHRAPSNLAAVDLESVPSEIEPLIIELNSLFFRLQDAFEREKRFTGDAAHELKTPLAALSAQVQVALRMETIEERNEALLKVLAGVNRATHVVQQLLTLSRMVPEATPIETKPVNLARQTSEIAAMLAPEAIAKNIDLELLAPHSSASIEGDPTAISILVRNLIDNAIRYSHEGGTVSINILENKTNTQLTVTDNGPGIPEELRERVFERFFRMPGTKTTGSGLGLGIVMRIVKLHDATIELNKPEGTEGLEVVITFPK